MRAGGDRAADPLAFNGIRTQNARVWRCSDKFALKTISLTACVLRNRLTFVFNALRYKTTSCARARWSGARLHVAHGYALVAVVVVVAAADAAAAAACVATSNQSERAVERARVDPTHDDQAADARSSGHRPAVRLHVGASCQRRRRRSRKVCRLSARGERKFGAALVGARARSETLFEESSAQGRNARSSRHAGGGVASSSSSSPPPPPVVVVAVVAAGRRGRCERRRRYRRSDHDE